MTLRGRPWLAAIAAALLAAGAPRALAAQSYFGQNQVQYDRFDWHVLETEHFLVYYYPEEHAAVMDAARMAERSYARLARLLDHQFREKKPLVLFSSRTDFGQNNVTGDLGEGTGGVTEALRHRMLLPFTGDMKSFEHVLGHEMTHAFQYDIFARGKAGNGLQALAQVNVPLWFAEGMAEYLSLGPSSTLTDTWMRDAAMNGGIPSVEQMSERPDRYFPYRFGHAFWAYIGSRWGDEAIGQIMNSVPSVGVERAFKRQLGLSLEDLGDEWKEDMQRRYLPAVATLERPRKFSSPLLNARKSGGEIFLAPSLSQDGRYIAFLSNGKFSRGEVFVDLWLGDAITGKRIKRIVKSTTDPNYEELRLLYSQSSFSPDGRQLAFTAQYRGRDVLYLADVQSRSVTKRFTLPLEGVTSPSWSPDGRQLVVSGNVGGITDLYVVDADGHNMKRLTNDKFGDLQPQWSPDGKSIVFATDRGDSASVELLRFPKWRIATYELEGGHIAVLPGQAGLNINPQWAPDGKSIAFLSDRTGTANLYLYETATHQHFQLTDVVGAIGAITEYSPAISWAHGADRLAFTYYEDGQYTIWQIDDPRQLKRAPFNPAKVIAQVAPFDTTHAHGDTLDAPLRTLSVAALLDSSDFALPDTARFRDSKYRVRFQPDYVARPAIGYTPDTYGRNVFGGTTIVLSDMLGNNRVAFSGEVNGRIAESRVFMGYTSLGSRWQFSTGISQNPYYFLSSDSLSFTPGTSEATEHQEITTYIARQLFAVTAYPLNRFSRIEFGGGFNNIDRQRVTIDRTLVDGRVTGDFTLKGRHGDPSLNYVDAQLAYVSDNTLFGYTGPILGRRYRFQVSPVVGSFDWVEYLADYRRYDAILFNYLTFATRAYANMSIGRDESTFPKYIARPDFVRGYDRNSSFYSGCPVVGANTSNCSAVQLLGSRVAVANAELRFPLVRRFELGILPIALPPLDGLFFYDIGAAWSRDQALYGGRPMNYDVTRQRYPLRSYGAGLRLNLFGYAILRWDYAVPVDAPGRKGFWSWSLWPGF
ncbi:MAG: surface antigen [Gemmatimonadetes bacterium]|nr:surface antigen [Gemmatimonadota bacterium]